MKKSRYTEIAYNPKGQNWLLYNFYTDEFLFLNDEEKDCFDAFPNKELSEQLSDRLAKGGFLTDTDELEALRQLTQKNIREPEEKFLKLVICPTMDCNFDCVYCIENGQKCEGKMSESVQRNVVKFVEQMLDEIKTDRLIVTWYGGEPLLAMDAIEELSRQFKAVCAARNVRYRAAVVTNGYFLDAHAMLKLDRCGIRYYRVTIDGPAYAHDKWRMRKDGAPTYSRIMENLKGILTDNTIEIRCNVSRSNRDSVNELVAEIDALRERTGNKILLTFAKMLVSRNVPKSLKSDMLTEAEFADFVLNGKENFHRENHHRSGVPCAGCRRYDYCIDSSGDIYKCNAFLTQKEHRLANVSELPTEETLFRHSESLSLRQKAFPEYQECLECKLLPWCYGSCPLDDGITSKKRCNRYRLHLKEMLLKLADACEQGGSNNE